MKNHRTKVFTVLFITLIISISKIESGCPVTDNPSQMFQCLTINPQAFIDLISKGDYKSFCHMANGYMTCMTTYVRDCLGGKAATGILEELQDLNLKCCISGRTQECVVKNPALLQKCFSADNFLTLANGDLKQIMNAQIGDKVKAVDSNGDVVDSEIVYLMHKNLNSSTLFQTMYDSDNNYISMTSSHLVYVKGNGYVKASGVKTGDHLRIYSQKQHKFEDFQVKRIGFEVKNGFIAPLTSHGTLLVNNIDSSCYAEVNSHCLADLAMTPIKLWSKISNYFNSKHENLVVENVDINLYLTFLYQFSSKYLPSYLN